jgi:hypothetical protein
VAVGWVGGCGGVWVGGMGGVVVGGCGGVQVAVGGMGGVVVGGCGWLWVGGGAVGGVGGSGCGRGTVEHLKVRRGAASMTPSVCVGTRLLCIELRQLQSCVLTWEVRNGRVVGMEPQQ